MVRLNEALDGIFMLVDAQVGAGLGNEQLGSIPIVDLKAGGANTTTTSFWADIIWQAPERWSYGFTYFKSEADTEQITSSDITFGDLVIPTGTGFRGDFETKFYVLNAYYDFYQSPHNSAGVGLGLYALD